jgi:hypothetical protein
MITRAGKIAAALFAVYFAYYLKSTLLGYATEPKAIGGVDLDRPIPQVMFWTPIYYPMLLSTAFAYWIWPTKAYPSLARRMVSGSFAIVRVILFTLFISFLCTGFGAFYLALPQLMTAEILPMLASVFLSALQGTAVMSIFHIMGFIPISVFVGSLVALGAHVASKHLSSPMDERVRLDFVSFSTVLRSSNEWPWPSLVAGFVIAAMMLTGFSIAGLPIIVLWGAFFVHWGIPCVVLGAAIGFFGRHWAWCAAVSLPIAYYLSTTAYRPTGILASQAIDFPPVVIATLVGFSLARKFVPRIFNSQAT